MHRADEVSFRIVEVDTGADGGNVEFGHHYFAAARFNGADSLIDVVNADRTLEAGHTRSGHRFAALVEQALDSRVAVVAGPDQVEIRRAPRFKAPAEYLLIEAAGAGDVIGRDSKTLKVVWHRTSIREIGWKDLAVD